MKHIGAKSDDWNRLTVRILSLGRYVLGGDLRRVLAPEVATLRTWENIFETGGIVVVDCLSPAGDRFPARVASSCSTRS